MQKIALIGAMVWFLSLGLSTAASAEREFYSGQVVSVQDGDTLTLVTVDYEQLRVRFYGIDAPEKNQSHGQQARERLQKLVGGQSVTVEVVDTDRYGRAVGLVRLAGVLVNQALVEEGWAWLYPQYCKLKDICAKMSQAENRARRSGLGLWAAKDPTPPWQWRRGTRKKSGGAAVDNPEISPAQVFFWSRDVNGNRPSNLLGFFGS